MVKRSQTLSVATDDYSIEALDCCLAGFEKRAGSRARVRWITSGGMLLLLSVTQPGHYDQ